MNKVIASGYIANEPKYTVRHEFRETMLRALLIEDEGGTIIPLVFFNWSAERARKKFEKGSHVMVEGRIAGGFYKDETGAMRYQNYLVVNDFSCTLDDAEEQQLEDAINFGAADTKFPLDVTDFEDMIQVLSLKR